MVKRTLSIVLALIMALSILSITVVDAALMRGTVAIQVGQTHQIGSADSQGMVCFPTNWYSTNPSVVTITYDGYVTGVKVGEGIVCFVDSYGVECGMKIIVQGGPSGDSSGDSSGGSTAKTYKLTKTKLTLTAGKSATIKLRNAKASKVKWSTSNKKVATVSKGKITAKKKGTATITAKYGRIKYNCKVTVKAKPAKKVSISKKSASMTVGSKLTLKLKNAKASKVKWSSSNKKIATVSSKGVVTAKKKGKATITAKYGSKKYKCTITVKAKAKKKLTPNEAFEKLVAYAKKHDVGTANDGSTFRARISKDKKHNCYFTAYNNSKSIWFVYETYDSRYPDDYMIDEAVTLKHYKSNSEKDLISFTSYSLEAACSQYFETSQIGSSMTFSFKDPYGEPQTKAIERCRTMFSNSYKKWDNFLRKNVGVSMKDLGFRN